MFTSNARGANRPKYGNRKTMVGRTLFDSKKEAERYLELKSMEKLGKIRAIEMQVPYVLLDSFVRNGKRERAIIYVADFRYELSDGTVCVEDVKGFRTEIYRIKRKLFFNRYPEINFKEV